VVDHAAVPTEGLRVLGRAAEDLDPPEGDVHPMFLAHPAREQRTEQIVALDAVVEGVDQPAEAPGAAGSDEQRGFLAHGHHVTR